MVMAMMSVLVVILIIRVARRVVIWINAFLMIMIMGMKARGGHVLLHAPMQPRRRSPGELERDDEHDDQGDEATHAGHCTALQVFTKGALHKLAFRHADLLVPNDSHYFADAGKVI